MTGRAVKEKEDTAAQWEEERRRCGAARLRDSRPADLSPCVVGRPMDWASSTRPLESLNGVTY